MNQSTQTNIPIAGIKDGILILRSGEYRIILEVASINFELKSEQEQNAIVFQYQAFLNSLHYPIEIVMQSKKLDLTPYLKKVKDLAAKQTNELIKIQTEDYVEFIGQLINLANIMKKRFYVVVGYSPIAVSNGLLDKLFHHNQPQAKLRINEDDFNSYAKELRQYAQNVAQGLGNLGLHCRQLVTKEVIELFYEIYNPEVAGKERLDNPNDVAGSLFTSLKSDHGQEEAKPDQDTAGHMIDNHDLVQAAQQQQTKDMNVEQAKAREEEKEKAEAEEDEPLPGEKKPEEAKPLTPEQQNTDNYGS